MENIVFHGVCTALVTPFSENGINYTALDRLIDRQLEAGVDALLVCGTTGEAATLTNREKLSLISYCVRKVGGKCKVIAGTGGNCTKSAVTLSRAAAELGADALLCVTPYYNRCTQEGLIAHFTAIADAAKAPVILYNVPSRTSVDLLPATCAALSGHPNICGLKEAVADPCRVLRVHSLCKEDFPVWCGCDEQTLAFLACGAAGVISVLSNVAPAQVVQLYAMCRAGSFDAAAVLQRQLLPLTDALFSEVSPIPVKQALRLTGLDVGVCRLPLTPPGEQLCERLHSALTQLGLPLSDT